MTRKQEKMQILITVILWGDTRVADNTRDIMQNGYWCVCVGGGGG